MIEFVSGLVVGFLIASWLAWTYGVNEANQQLILDLLTRAREPMYGLELIAQSGGALKRGTIYVQLGRLADHGLVYATPPGPDGRRRYALSATQRTEKS